MTLRATLRKLLGRATKGLRPSRYGGFVEVSLDQDIDALRAEMRQLQARLSALESAQQ